MTRRGQVGIEGGRGVSPFFGSRLGVPANPEHYVRRPRLIRLLDQVSCVPLTLVVAPAGSGKTTLLVDFCDASPVPTAWISLDETDRDGVQLWAAVATALAGLVAGLEVSASSLDRQGTPAEAMVTLLAALGSEHPPSVRLVLDDLHLVEEDEAVMASLSRFLRSMPDWLHVVLLSRRRPRLHIDRLRGRGQLGEVHFAELRFSVEEAEDMLARLAPFLVADEVVAAVHRADGWAAGLQLSALAARLGRAQGGTPSRVGDSDVLIADYVWNEVLSGERRSVVEALLDTSIVTRTNAALASALTGCPDAGELLREAESRGLFVTRLGTSGWLEVHAVVRAELLAELTRRSPERVSMLHARAATWFESTGDVVSAVEHWVLADQPREVLRLLSHHVGELYDDGHESTITRSISRIPVDVAESDVHSMLDFAWCHLLVDPRRFVELVRRAGASLTRFGDPGSTAIGRLWILEAVAATINGDWAGGGQLAAQGMAALSDACPADPVGRFGWNIVTREIALSETWDEESPLLEQARLELGRDPERRLAYEGTRALGVALAGLPVDALRIAAGVRDVATVNSMTVLRAELAIAEAVAHRELGDRARAMAEFASLTQSRIGTVPHAHALALLELTLVRLDEGDLDSAYASFQRAHDFFRTDFTGRGGFDWLARTGTLVALASGHINDARGWSERIHDPFWGGVSSARVQLLEGRRSEAAALLDGVVPRCLRHEVVRDLLRAQAVPTRLEAIECVGRGVELASGAGLVQTVASEGPKILELLEVCAWSTPTSWLDRVRRAASPNAGTQLLDPSLPGEHLTDRELEVLRMLPSRLTLREIAGELFISVNTVKFHLRVIYRKLGVGSRAEASVAARHLTSLGRADRSANLVRK